MAVKTVGESAAGGKPRRVFLSGLRRYLADSLAEVKKVSWPSFAEVCRFTLVVLVTVAVVSLFIYLADILLSFFSRPLFAPH
jgi:preprotein translocase subunit SecE